MTRQACPICGAEVEPSERYPRRVCDRCAARATSTDGRSLAFFNLDLSGGYGARYADTDEAYDSHECLIDGVRCRAEEARCGGIVIEVADTTERTKQGV